MLDAHVHLWDLDRVHLSWFRPDLALPRVVTAEDLARASRGAVEAAVAVQAGDTLGEAEWLAGHAATHPIIPAIVLQYEAGRPWAGIVQPVVDASTRSDAPHPRVAGIRVPTPQGAADLSDVRGLDRLADGLATSGLVLELLIRPDQLPAAAALAARHPELTVVICHLGLGRGTPDATWRRGLDAIAAHDRVLAKLSGLHADGDDAARVAGIAATAFDALGPDRLMFGSDWPMSARVAPYPEIVERTADALPELDATAADAFWHGTAARAYALPAPADVR
ncbi:amidohydrolase family protein [Agromyces sp. G08B096]|uniref:Amidohydrolase family protein n=1 Tax=Agromyces sp. G08B096 TaxID=3156399 RepID=A0AAU7W4M0_9MICO